MLRLVTRYRPGNDAALVAARIADYCLAIGQSAVIQSDAPPVAGVHPYWDARVRRLDAAVPGRLVAVGVRPGLATPTFDSICAPDWFHLSRAERLQLFAWPFLALSGTRVAASCLNHGSSVLPVSWDTGFTPRPLRGRTGRLLVWLDRQSLRRWRGVLGHFLAQLACSAAELVLLTWSTLTAEDRRTCRRLNVRLAAPRSAAEILAEVADAEAVLSPALPVAFGLPARYAAVCGKAFVGFAVPPHCESPDLQASLGLPQHGLDGLARAAQLALRGKSRPATADSPLVPFERAWSLLLA